MKVALVSTWGTVCGIAEHATLLKTAVETSAPKVGVIPCPEALDPGWFRNTSLGAYDLIHLNYHAALHSRWTPDVIEEVRRKLRIPITVTYHDTGVPNSDQCKGVVGAADAAIVHEPFDDLPDHVEYWRMGVPGWSGYTVFDQQLRGASGRRPVLGTIGFPFPWKNYDQLARVTAENGWALLLIAPNHTAADRMLWERLNPHIEVYGFLRQTEALSYLAGCDATAFCYTCANTGQSGAILQGIAARKPVIAFHSTICRQFRALNMDLLGSQVIKWADSFQEVGQLLRNTVTERVDTGIVALAQQDGWDQLGDRYAYLWQGL